MKVEFNTYQLFIHSSPAAYRIIQVFMDYNLVGQISFHSEAKMPGAKLVNKHIHLEMPLGAYSDVVDLIRNEKPVYLFYNEDNQTGGLMTDPTEEVGEGEK